MTKSRKIGITLAFMLTFVLVCAVVVPLYIGNNADKAEAVVVQTRDEWVNPYNGNYYASIENSNNIGAVFRSELASLITSTHTTYTSYSGSSKNALNNVWPQSDVDPRNPNSGKMVWFYTGTLTSGSNFGSTAGTTNREHVWAKRGSNSAAFDGDAQKNVGSDAHHLRPTEVNLNNARGDKWFDELTPGSSGVTIAAQNGSTTYGTAPDGLCYTNSNYFYPAKGYRGATARILFYVQTRWGDKYGLEFSDTLQHSNVKLIGIISTLMKWHLEEPPTEEEIYHNNIIAGIQGNRNPFIDHPEYAEIIYCNNGQSYNNALKNMVSQYGSYLNSNPGGGTVPPEPAPNPTGITLSAGSLNLTIGQTANITVAVTPSNANNSVNWSTSDSSVATVNNGVVTAVGAGTATITATSAVDSTVKASLTFNVTKLELKSISILSEPFSLTPSGTKQLTVEVSPQGADNRVTWSSSNESVATVSATGLVTAVATGTATITVASVDNPDITDEVTVTVISQEQNLKAFTDSMAALEGATTLQDRYNAIKRAFDAYYQMTDLQKASKAADFAKLQQAMYDYNDEIGVINGEFASANDLAAQIMSNSVSLSFMALVAIVVKALLGR